MLRRSKMLRCAISAVLLAFGAQVAVPHFHAAANHEAKFCGGHLSDHGAPDEQHPGACPMCRTPNRTRLFVAAVAGEAAPAPEVALTDGPCTPRPTGPSVGLSTLAPRAPPLRASIV